MARIFKQSDREWRPYEAAVGLIQGTEALQMQAEEKATMADQETSILLYTINHSGMSLGT